MRSAALWILIGAAALCSVFAVFGTTRESPLHGARSLLSTDRDPDTKVVLDVSQSRPGAENQFGIFFEEVHQSLARSKADANASKTLAASIFKAKIGPEVPQDQDVAMLMILIVST